MFTLTKHIQDVDRPGQAGAFIETTGKWADVVVTPVMIDAALTIYLDWLEDGAPRQPDERRLLEDCFRAMLLHMDE
jgi:hypothetical protein